jgi:hypothetical protein
MADFDWKLSHLSVFRCGVDPKSPAARPRKAVEHVGSRSRFGEGQELLEELIDHLLASAWAKKVDIAESSACRAWAFKPSAGGGEDRELLEGLVSAGGARDFEGRALVLSERYAGLPRARDGVLIHVSAVVDSGRARGVPFYGLFKCDFEEARRLADDLTLESVPEVMIRKLKKMVLYPYFDGFQQDPARLKLFQASASDYFHELLAIDRPATARELFQRELAEAVGSRFDDRYDDYFVSMPPAKRELFGEERYVPLNDLMPAPEVRYVTERSCQAAREKYDRPIRVSIRIDDAVKVDADLAGLGKSFFFARKGDVRYMIVRGERFVSGGQLSSLDFLNVESLEEILPRVSADASGGGDDA